MIDLTPRQLKQVIRILETYVAGIEVWAFGSRVRMTAEQYSDLDLVIVGEERIPQKVFYKIKDAFEESELDIKVDVLDWHRISSEFQKNIKLKSQIIYPIH